MRYATSLGLAILLCAATSTRAQYFTPAPVDLTGFDSGYGTGFGAVIAEDGEMFFWNESVLYPLPTNLLVISCDVGCLDPAGYISLAEQATDPALKDQYLALFGVNLPNSAPVGTPPTANLISSLWDEIRLPIGKANAFSLGRIIDGTPEQISEWVENEEIHITYTKRIGVNFEFFEFPVQYTTFVPEPSTIGLAALSLAGLALAGRFLPLDRPRATTRCVAACD